MIDYLIVGDTHLAPNSLEEGSKLFDFVIKTAKSNNISTIICLGDDIDGFGTPSTEVQHYFYNLLNNNKDLRWIMLVGNHSSPHSSRKFHSLLHLKGLKNVTIVDEPTTIDGMDFYPYCDKEEFINFPKNSEILFAHQEFDGSEYENGFFAKNGLKKEEIKHSKIISGHIHKSALIQAEGLEIWHPGAPRWMKTSDANQEKYIYIWNPDKKDVVKLSTWPVCKRIEKLIFNQSEPEPEFLVKENTRYLMEITGTKKYCQELSEKYKGLAEIKVFTTKENTGHKVSESQGLENAIFQYIKNQYNPQFGISKEELLAEIERTFINEQPQ